MNHRILRGDKRIFRTLLRDLRAHALAVREVAGQEGATVLRDISLPDGLQTCCMTSRLSR